MKKKETTYLSSFCNSVTTGGLITSIEAAERFNITNDYITRLCRGKKIIGFLIGRLWYVEEGSLKDLLKQSKEKRKEHREKLSKSLKSEYYAHAARTKETV